MAFELSDNKTITTVADGIKGSIYFGLFHFHADSDRHYGGTNRNRKWTEQVCDVDLELWAGLIMVWFVMWEWKWGPASG